MKIIRPAVFAIAALALSACSGGASSSTDGAPTVSAPPVTTNTPSPTSTKTSVPSTPSVSSPPSYEESSIEESLTYGKAGKVETISIKTTDGYEAEIKARWYKTSQVNFHDLSASCIEQLNMVQKANFADPYSDESHSFHVTSFEVEAEFPDVGSFSWPEDWDITATEKDLPSCKEIVPTDVAAEGLNWIGEAHLNPDSPREIMNFIEVGKKTPNNTKGTSDPFDNLTVVVGVSGDSATCVNSAGDPDWISQCISPYPW